MPRESRTAIIKAIKHPLAFFTLALLLVETFIGTVVLKGNLQSGEKMAAIWAGVGMFVMVVLMVFLLTWFKPIHLGESRKIADVVTPEPELGTRKPKPSRSKKKPKRTIIDNKGDEP
jgi:heme A synthase